ncbi:hypothetical protein [Blastomonas sp.]|uniref:hypothetical protein n=1 Tax=Blastomonas sp. TaxID=1909299 RepID=UPI003592FB0B
MNIAARLESLCKTHDVSLVLGADIVPHIGDRMTFQQIEKIAARRRSECRKSLPGRDYAACEDWDVGMALRTIFLLTQRQQFSLIAGTKKRGTRPRFSILSEQRPDQHDRNQGLVGVSLSLSTAITIPPTMAAAARTPMMMPVLPSASLSSLEAAETRSTFCAAACASTGVADTASAASMAAAIRFFIVISVT